VDAPFTLELDAGDVITLPPPPRPLPRGLVRRRRRRMLALGPALAALAGFGAAGLASPSLGADRAASLVALAVALAIAWVLASMRRWSRTFRAGELVAVAISVETLSGEREVACVPSTAPVPRELPRAWEGLTWLAFTLDGTRRRAAIALDRRDRPLLVQLDGAVGPAALVDPRRPHEPLLISRSLMRGGTGERRA
jgi:hypothetical protein